MARTFKTGARQIPVLVRAKERPTPNAELRNIVPFSVPHGEFRRTGGPDQAGRILISLPWAQAAEVRQRGPIKIRIKITIMKVIVPS